MLESGVSISLVTVPNGYLLRVGVQEYLYFSVCDLVTGFLYHVGMGELRYASLCDMECMVSACMTWRERSACVERLVSLEGELSSLRSQLDDARERLEQLPKVDGKRLKGSNIERLKGFL